MTTRPLRLVAPFLPVPPESPHHQAMVDFDWMAAIRMLSHSAERACGVPVQVLTDHGAQLPVPSLTYATTHRRLMLWTLEVCLRYLESDDFDRDTVMLDCDQLVFEDLRRFFTPYVDLALLVRPTHKHQDTWKKVLNGVQFWSVRGKARLIPFYREALRRAEAMSEGLVTWGADTAAIRDLIEPVQLGLHERAGARVQLLNYDMVLEALSEDQIAQLARGVAPVPRRPVLDFRYKRKLHMAAVYALTVGRETAVCR